MAIPIITYHKIDRRFEWGITRISPKRFEEQMASLARMGYQAVSLSQVLASGDCSSTHKRCFVLTFDDGYEGIYYYAFPVLKRLGFTATVFMVTGYIGDYNLWDVNLGWRRFRHLDWSQIETMQAAGITFGSHSVTHPDLTRLPVEEMDYELQMSRKTLEGVLGTPVCFFSYPFGRFSPMLQERLQLAGYKAAVVRGANEQVHPFALGSQGIYPTDGTGTLIRLASGQRPGGLRQLGNQLIHFCAAGTPWLKGFLERGEFPA